MLPYCLDKSFLFGSSETTIAFITFVYILATPKATVDFWDSFKLFRRIIGRRKHICH